METVLIADDEKVTRAAFSLSLKKEGFQVVEAEDGRRAIELFREARPAVVLLDILMPVMNGMEAIRAMKSIDPLIPVIIVTGQGDITMAVETMKLGAYDFLVKPVEPLKLLVAVNRAIEKLKLDREVTRLHIAEDASLERFAGKNQAMKKITGQLREVAGSDFSIIIQGETGTGKSLLARIIHNMSGRADKRFTKIDMGSYPESVIESELFGYEKGAFTNALQAREGYFESAHKGTAFLDDLQNVPLSIQSKLLNVLESREICRIGSRQSMRLDLRFIAATNADLGRSVSEGKFREDLFFRLGEFIITLPPLRERGDDIPYFVNVFREAATSELNIPAGIVSQGAIDAMTNHSWPGNLRELKNVVRRAVLLSRGGAIEPEHIEFLLHTKEHGEGAGESALIPLRQAVESVEKKMIARAIETVQGNKSRAATLLQVDVKTLRSKMHEYGLD